MVELVLSPFLPEYGKMEAMLKCEARSGGEGGVIPSFIATSWTRDISLHPHKFLIPGIKRQSHCLLP